MSEKPRLSVVVACYNTGAYLDEALDSIYGQSFGDFELILADDGSTDAATRNALSRAALRPRAALLRLPHRGAPAARNAAISLARGELLCAVDSDDRVLETWFEDAISALDGDPGLSFVSHWLRAFGDEDWEWRPETCDLASVLDSFNLNGATVVRRAAVDAVGGYEESLAQGCEDWDLWIRLVAAGHRGVILPRVYYLYRQRPGSLSRFMARGLLHPQLVARLVQRHRSLYAEHLRGLLVARAGRLAALDQGLVALDAEYHGPLGEALLARRAERAALAAARPPVPDEEAR